MAAGDEAIITKRQMALRKKTYNISAGELSVLGQDYTFEERTILNKFRIVLPEQFYEMPEDYARRKYLSENRPPVILTGDDRSVNFAFRERPFSNEDIYSRLDLYRESYKEFKPYNVFFNFWVEDDRAPIGCFDYQSPGVQENIYNLFFFFDCMDHELFGWFNCLLDSRDDWEPIVRQILQTIKPVITESV